MRCHFRRARLLMLLLASGITPAIYATASDPADPPTERFLSRTERQHAYRATRHLKAANGDRRGWLVATTQYSAAAGFRYQITSGGGSDYIRTNVLKAVLDGERDMIALGEAARSTLARTNYTFQPNGIDAEGFANVLLTPRRKERSLISGVMFLRPDEAELVRLEGRLARNPSFWVKDVTSALPSIGLATSSVPLPSDPKAHVRFLGAATFSMTYDYTEIDGRCVN